MNVTWRKYWCGLFVMAMSFSIFKAWGQPGVADGSQPLVAANSAFGFRLLKELALEQPHANLFFSPYSVSSVLQMLSAGAGGQTRKELDQVLGTSDVGAARMQEAYQRLRQSIGEAQSNVVLTVANALWYRDGVRLENDFSSANQKFYEATIQSLNFSDPHSVDVMNDWAARNTNDKIKSIIQPPLPADTGMILANAVYFKGAWLNPFDPKQTEPRPFHQVDGREKQVPMMKQSRKFFYQEGDGFQAVQLPYDGKRLRMHVVLPSTNLHLVDFFGRLDARFWQQTILNSYRETKGTVVLPRFGLRYGAELKPSLSALGLKNAWNAKADFTGISSEPLFLSKIEHQSFVEVNEEGTEAAAVTTGVMALASFESPRPPFQMIVDRPFLFLISDQVTGSILFIGAVFDP